jgi:flagellar protein FlgJ
MDQLAPTSRTPLSSLSLDQSRQYGQKPTMNQVGKAFETLFMQTMMKSMRDAQLEGGLLDSEHEKPFQSMLDGIYSEMSVKKTNLGLAEAINRQFAPKTGPKVSAGAQAQQASLTAAQTAALSSGLQTGTKGEGFAGVNALPTSDLAASLTAQQGMSFKTVRQPGLPIGNPAQKLAPKFMTGG